MFFFTFWFHVFLLANFPKGTTKSVSSFWTTTGVGKSTCRWLDRQYDKIWSTWVVLLGMLHHGRYDKLRLCKLIAANSFISVKMFEVWKCDMIIAFHMLCEMYLLYYDYDGQVWKVLKCTQLDVVNSQIWIIYFSNLIRKKKICVLISIKTSLNKCFLTKPHSKLNLQCLVSISRPTGGFWGSQQWPPPP